MDRIIVGIDVSKDRLDVAVRPSGEAFAVSRNAAGIEQLVARLRKLSPHIVALEATGGFETVVAAALAAAGLPGAVVMLPTVYVMPPSMLSDGTGTSAVTVTGMSRLVVPTLLVA